ncbi:MAG: TauD/TfdA family dioxygenase [Novosphingobium sp.]|nr:TauD/TfdA family dioxygenase [Novosphingobium sp.]
MACMIEKLSDDLTFGCVVTGLTQQDLESPETRDELRQRWLIDGLVIFRGSTVTPAFQIALSDCFAETIIHPVKEIRHPEHEKLIRLVSNPQGEDEDLIEVDGVAGCGWLPWHKDIIFTDKINHGGILHATKITSTGGETGYIDQIDAWDRLEDKSKREIEDLEVVYKFGPPESSPWCCREQVRYIKTGPANRSMYARAESDWPAVVHPLVFTQQATGRKALNLSPRFAQSIVGMGKTRGDELLTILSNHLWDSPSYHHTWSPDEMVLWDNWRMLHRVTPAPYEEVRIVERTTLDGDYGLGRKLPTAA